MRNFNFAAKRLGTVHVLITILKSAQSDHLIDTKHIVVNLTLEIFNLQLFLQFLAKPMKIRGKLISHFCLARQDESIDVKIVTLSSK